MLVPLGVRQGFGASFQLVQGAEDAAGTDRLAPSGGGWEVTHGPCRTQEPGQEGPRPRGWQTRLGMSKRDESPGAVTVRTGSEASHCLARGSDSSLPHPPPREVLTLQTGDS